MRIVVQWATDPAAGWQHVQAQAWRGLASKADPTGTTPTIDSSKGWINALGVQGVMFHADHYAVDWVSEGPEKVTKVWKWLDHPVHAATGRVGYLWTFREYKLDSRRGIFNTRQSCEVFAEGEAFAKAERTPRQTTMGQVPLRPFADFPFPDAALIRHGVTLPDELHAEHLAIQERMDWREWTEGVPASHLDRGKVRMTRLER